LCSKQDDKAAEENPRSLNLQAIRILWLLPFVSLVSAVSVGCSSVPFSDGIPCSPNGFINETEAPDAQLLALWQGAQTQLATQPIPLDPVTDPNDVTYAPPDSNAMSVGPLCQVKIVAMPPAPNVPNGFVCTASPTGYCGGLTMGGKDGPWTIEVVSSELNSAGTTGWEMQNVILYKLGVSFSGR
jgi:hypothetical protein